MADSVIPKKAEVIIMAVLALLIAVGTGVADQMGVDAPRWLTIVVGVLGAVAALFRTGVFNLPGGSK